MEFKIWLYFLLTEFLLSITPGPAVLLVSTQGLKYGVKASYFGSIGITTGNALYFILSAAGIGTLILTSGNLFDYIKLTGAIYLVVAGAIMIYKTYKHPKTVFTVSVLSQNNFKSFLQGLIIQAANPKAIIFFVALLPQFIDPVKNVLLQFIILAITSIIIETFVLMFYGWLAAKGKKLAGKNQKYKKWQNRILGSVLIGLGINIFFSKHRLI